MGVSAQRESRGAGGDDVKGRSHDSQ
jgi:hypothetical protein